MDKGPAVKGSVGRNKESMKLLKETFLGNSDVLAGFTNRHGGVSEAAFHSLNIALHVGDNPDDVEKNREILMDDLSLKHISWMEQVHSNNIKIVNNAGVVAKSDGIITNKIGLALLVMVADCIPMLFFDRVQKVVAVAHAGREGSFKNIAGKTAEEMQNAFQSKPEDMLVSFGPSIQGSCYKFDGKYLDLPQLNKEQLLNVGIKKENILASTVCTHCNKDYFSYSRNSKTGRFAGLIMLK